MQVHTPRSREAASGNPPANKCEAADPDVTEAGMKNGAKLWPYATSPMKRENFLGTSREGSRSDESTAYLPRLSKSSEL